MSRRQKDVDEDFYIVEAIRSKRLSTITGKVEYEVKW
jgi:hypothetical protein